mmetsp:Transcript_25167/g.60852  ORF Transcript_25167/g.60852 Transcript_25167/m.60852 type:complete len:209 (+) Transcript_25167:1-627(+)
MLGQWMPHGHNTFTPLWRLDKLIAFPYHDERKLVADFIHSGGRDIAGSGGREAGCALACASVKSVLASQRIRDDAGLQQLVRRAQGPLDARPVEAECEGNVLLDWYNHAADTVRAFFKLPAEGEAPHASGSRSGRVSSGGASKSDDPSASSANDRKGILRRVFQGPRRRAGSSWRGGDSRRPSIRIQDSDAARLQSHDSSRWSDDARM